MISLNILPYLIGLIGLLLVFIGIKYSRGGFIVRGRDVDVKSLLAVGSFILASLALLKFFGIV
jgi:hypothetical protein